MQQMASDIFVRILRGMGACRKKARTACEWHSQLDDSIGNTPTTVSWWVWGYEVGLGWRLASSGISLPNNVFSWLLSDFTGPFSRPKNPSKTCAPQGASHKCGGCCCLHVCSILRLPWLADKKEIVFLEVLRLFCQKIAMKCIPKRVKKVEPKTGPELTPIFGAC